MANYLKVTKAITLNIGNTVYTYAINDLVDPYAPQAAILNYASAVIDSGIASPNAGASPIVLPNTTPSYSLAPVVANKFDGNIVLSSGAGWADIDPSGTAVSRSLDVLIPGVRTGDWVSMTPNFNVSTSTTRCWFDCFTIVAGAPVHQFCIPAGTLLSAGPAAWQAEGSATSPGDPRISGTVSYQVQAGDIENGAVRLRMRYLQTTTPVRTVYGAGGFVIRFEGRGPFV